MSRTTDRRLRFGAALLLALAAALPATAHPLAAPAAQSGLAQSASTGGPRFVWDWHANGRAFGPSVDQAAIVRAVDRQRLGHGSWICSPSGSGMRSNCFQR